MLQLSYDKVIQTLLTPLKFDIFTLISLASRSQDVFDGIQKAYNLALLKPIPRVNFYQV